MELYSPRNRLVYHPPPKKKTSPPGHDARRTVPCIGVTPFGALKDAWRSTVDVAEAWEVCWKSVEQWYPLANSQFAMENGDL